MKKNLLSKNIHQWLLLLVCFVGTLPSWAERYPKDGIIYDLDKSAKTAIVIGLEDKSATSVEIRSYALGCKVTSIGESAFEDCRSLTSINIPNSVTNIENHAFNYCSSLTSINIPSSVTSIEGGAFYDCSSLTSINIPSSVTSIEQSAFSDCSALTAFTVDANNPNYCAEGCMLFNKEKTTIIKAVGSQKTYNIPSSVTSIEGRAFSGCSALTSINIPSFVTSIGESAFSGCSSLTSINIPSSVTSIKSGAFSGCSSLTSINIPSSVTSIGYGAFSHCSALKTIVLQSDRILLGESVFEDCGSIYAISDNLEIDINFKPSYYNTADSSLGGTWYTCGKPIITYNGSVTSFWNGHLLDKKTAQYLRTIFKTSTNAQKLILNHNAIYNNLSEDLRKDLEENLQKVDDLVSVIAEGDVALSTLSTNLSKAYKNVCEAVYEQLGLSDLYKLYAQAEDFTSALDNTPDYSPLLPTYIVGNNILTSADQLSTNKRRVKVLLAIW